MTARSQTALVVFAHPVPESLTAAARDRAVAGLRDAGVTVDEIDLHAIDFDPRATVAEMDGTSDVDSTLADHMERIQNAQVLVLIHPTWWGAQPAILKGWLDRIWLQPEAKRCFRGVRRLVVVSPHGSSRLRNAVQGVPGRRIVFRLLRSRCHPLARCKWVAFYSNDSKSDDDRVEFLADVEKQLKTIGASLVTSKARRLLRRPRS